MESEYIMPLIIGIVILMIFIKNTYDIRNSLEDCR